VLERVLAHGKTRRPGGAVLGRHEVMWRDAAEKRAVAVRRPWRLHFGRPD
jgi:hypothetical protein